MTQSKESICLFAGTTEGRLLAGQLANAYALTVCVATEYGEVLLHDIHGIAVRTGRMTEEEMARFFRAHAFTRILDATHPYATQVTENIQNAAASCGIPYLRILRDSETTAERAVYVSSVTEARDFLMGTDGNILITTGSKELAAYTGLNPSRLYARVLPFAASLEACAEAGIEPSHIIAMQGPFSEEMNVAQLHAVSARYLVTKESGKSGGFDEKIKAAHAADTIPVIIGRPRREHGITPERALALLGVDTPRRKVTIIGIGPGGTALLTREAAAALDSCDMICGARSVVASLSEWKKPTFHAILPQAIAEIIDAHPEASHTAVVMRGDTGFFSGTKKLTEQLAAYELSILPGISSPAYFAAKLGVSWDDAELISLHGRDGGLIHAVRTAKRVFALTGGENTVGTICKKLCLYGYGALAVTVGERLSYPDEKITEGTAETLAEQTFDVLSLLMIENKDATFSLPHGLADECFQRTDVPMTKAEVRSISLAVLAPDADAVVWDVGAGTGAVSVECAYTAHRGKVYAIEKNPEAVQLIRRNAMALHAENIEIVCGKAPEALESLPAPTHVFIGGSSGELDKILTIILQKNPHARITINTVTIETQAEALACIKKYDFSSYFATQIGVSRTRTVGRYHMVSAQNPVWIFTMQNV